MRIKIFSRILLAVFSILVFCLSVAGVILSLRILDKGVVQWWVDLLFTVPNVSVIAAAVFVILAVLAAHFILLSMSSTAEKGIVVKVTDNGAVRISVQTIDNLVQRHVRAVEYVRDLKSKIEIDRNNQIIIRLALCVAPETNIPEATAALQASLKENIQAYTGVSVKAVAIIVEDSKPMPATVEHRVLK